MEKHALNKKQVILFLLFLALIITSTIEFIHSICLASFGISYIFITIAYLLLLIVPVLMITKYKTYKEPKKDFNCYINYYTGIYYDCIRRHYYICYTVSI